jgi:hypothetical protein
MGRPAALELDYGQAGRRHPPLLISFAHAYQHHIVANRFQHTERHFAQDLFQRAVGAHRLADFE